MIFLKQVIPGPHSQTYAISRVAHMVKNKRNQLNDSQKFTMFQDTNSVCISRHGRWVVDCPFHIAVCNFLIYFLCSDISKRLICFCKWIKT